MRLLPLLLLLAACAPSTGLTVHNGTDSSLQITGLPEGPVVVDAGRSLRAGGIDAALTLVAKQTTGPQTWSAQPPLPPPGGEALWLIGGGACYVEGDFSEYYEMPADVPAQAKVVAVVPEGTETWASEGRVAAGPGEKLPKGSRGGPVVALVQVPCEATKSQAIAQGWLEMVLTELQPGG